MVATLPVLSLDPPESIRFDGEEKSVRVGGTVYRAIRHMMTRLTTPPENLKSAVWGHHAAERPEESLRSLLWRVNGLLRAHRSGRMLSLDGGRVVWVEDTQA